MSKTATTERDPSLPYNSPAKPTNDTLDLEAITRDCEEAKERYLYIEQCKRVKAQAEEYKRQTNIAIRANHENRRSAEEPHHTPVVKQEPDVAVPARRRWIEEGVIDLTTDSEDDSENDETPETPSTNSSHPKSSEPVPSSSNPNPSPISGLPAEIVHVNEAQAYLPARSLPHGHRVRTYNKRGIIRPRPAKKSKATTATPAVPVQVVAPPLLFKDPIDIPQIPQITSAPTTAILAGLLTPDSTQSMSPTVTEQSSSKVKLPTTKAKPPVPKSTPDHPYRYNGPEMTILSQEAIKQHLDLAWKQGSCTVEMILRLSRWWSTQLVVAAHQLDKHQIWLLEFAQYEWWRELEKQWDNFKALPDKDGYVIERMKEVRLKKASKMLSAEAAMVPEGLIKKDNAVYKLVGIAKVEKSGNRGKTAGGGKSKRARAEQGNRGVEGREAVEEGGGKEKKARSKDQRVIGKQVANDQTSGEKQRETDDGLSSDSDEEDD